MQRRYNGRKHRIDPQEMRKTPAGYVYSGYWSSTCPDVYEHFEHEKMFDFSYRIPPDEMPKPDMTAKPDDYYLVFRLVGGDELQDVCHAGKHPSINRVTRRCNTCGAEFMACVYHPSLALPTENAFFMVECLRWIAARVNGRNHLTMEAIKEIYDVACMSIEDAIGYHAAGGQTEWWKTVTPNEGHIMQIEVREIPREEPSTGTCGAAREPKPYGETA